jgi:thiol:disulfide interchange protein DsbA
MPNRRQFTQFASWFLLGAVPGTGAQGQPVEGTHYQAVSKRQPTRDPKRIEVLEFFAYSCHHCHDFEPALDDWQKKLPPDVLFRRIPVAFREDLVIHNELYFSLETLGLVEQLHRKTFEAVHGSRGGLKTPQDIAAFLQSQRADSTPVMEAVRSFAVATKVKQAFALANGYGIEGTPSLGIDGRWLTGGSMAGSNARSLLIAEYLIALARRAR